MGNTAALQKARYYARRDFVNRIKDNPCADCGVRYPPYVMQFDNIGTESHINVARLVSRAVSEERILREIEKCELVCANCHAERTFSRAGYIAEWPNR